MLLSRVSVVKGIYTTLMVVVTFRLCSALLSLGLNSSLEYLPWDKHIRQTDLDLLSYASTLYPENVSWFSSCGYSFIPLLMTASHLWSINFSFQTISPDTVTLAKPKCSHQKHQTSLKVYIFSKLSDVFNKEPFRKRLCVHFWKEKKTHSEQYSGRLWQRESREPVWGRTFPHHSFVRSSGQEEPSRAGVNLNLNTCAQHLHWLEGRSGTYSTKEQRGHQILFLCSIKMILCSGHGWDVKIEVKQITDPLIWVQVCNE